MHGNYTAVTAIQKADLLLALGSRFDDRGDGQGVGLRPKAKVVHVDIDKAEIARSGDQKLGSSPTAAWRLRRWSK